MVKKEQRGGLTETAIDTTLNVHKMAHRVQFKKKAPRAVREVKKWVSKLMKTSLGRDKLYLNKYMMQGKEENYA